MGTGSELEGHSQLIVADNSKGVFAEGSNATRTQDVHSQFGNSTLNDRDVSSANQSMMQPQNQAQGQDVGYSQYWQDAEGDYSSDEEENKEEDSGILNKVRVVVRVRPLIQGESNMSRRAPTNTSGQMIVDSQINDIQLKFDARNKEPKSYQFDKVCDGTTD